jgi:hypothetical protein
MSPALFEKEIVDQNIPSGATTMKIQTFWLNFVIYVIVAIGVAMDVQAQESTQAGTAASKTESEKVESPAASSKASGASANADVTSEDTDDGIDKSAKKRRKKEKKELQVREMKPREKTEGRSASSNDPSDIFKSLDYPELQVVPRASDRLLFEAQYESETGYWVHWPILLPTLANLYFSTAADGEYEKDATSDEKDDADKTILGAQGLSVFWIAATGVISLSRPYRAGLARVKKNKDSERRGELYRERISEEALEGQAKTMKIIVNLSVLSNLAITAAIASKHDVSSGEAGFIALLAFTPWVFEHRYIQAWEKQLEYKRKIYTPMSTVSFYKEPDSGKVSPLLAARWEF